MGEVNVPTTAIHPNSDTENSSSANSPIVTEQCTLQNVTESASDPKCCETEVCNDNKTSSNEVVDVSDINVTDGNEGNEGDGGNEGNELADLTEALRSGARLSDDEKGPQRCDNVGKVVPLSTKWPPAPKAIRQFAQWILGGSVQQVIVLAGAGMSVSAGIPDFRTPGTGLYDNLQLYDLPYAEAVFDISFFRRNPRPFCRLAAALWPGQLEGPVPTLAHSFVQLLDKHGLLRRIYTQNIDGLEHLANIPEERIVECHGHFRSATCTRCRKAAPDMAAVRNTIINEANVPLCQFCERNGKSSGYIKPDIVFFGESLPDRFHQLLCSDVEAADCCLIMGTSLQVAPVNHIPEMVHRTKCKRVLFNRELVGNIRPYGPDSRDLFHKADCDDSVLLVAELLGWKDELLQEHGRAVAAIRKPKQKQKHKKK